MSIGSITRIRPMSAVVVSEVGIAQNFIILRNILVFFFQTEQEIRTFHNGEFNSESCGDI